MTIYYFSMTPYFFFINQTLSHQRKIVKFFLILDFSLSPLTCMLHHQDLLVALYIKEKNPFIHWQKKKLAAALEHHQNLWPHIYKRKKKILSQKNYLPQPWPKKTWGRFNLVILKANLNQLSWKNRSSYNKIYKPPRSTSYCYPPVELTDTTTCKLRIHGLFLS